jgi:predicted DNA-binding protein with PD1-like motif
MGDEGFLFRSGFSSTVRVRHPGPLSPERFKSVVSSTSSAFRLKLRAGANLNESIVNELHTRGIHSAAINMVGGGFSRVSFCLTVPMGRADQIASYTPPFKIETPCDMVVGSGTLGLDEDGKTPLFHFHALLTTDDGTLRGGHIFPETAIVGDVPPVVFIRSLDAISVRRRFDPETNFSLLQPEPAAQRLRA